MAMLKIVGGLIILLNDVYTSTLDQLMENLSLM